MTISPDTGPCDGIVEITLSGLAPNATVRLDVGLPRSDQVAAALDSAMTDANGMFAGTRTLGPGGCSAAATDAAVPPGNGTFPIYAAFQPETLAVAARAEYRYASMEPSKVASRPTFPSTLVLTSDGFTNNGTIPAKYSCVGEAMSPALAWSGAPVGTKAFVLIVHDPDAPLAGGFTHWLVIDLPSTTNALPPAIFQDAAIPGGGAQLIGYRGMCPPVGAAPHHYHFRLYALDAALVTAGQSLPISSGDVSGKDSVEAAMQGHILAQTDLLGLFGR